MSRQIHLFPPAPASISTNSQKKSLDLLKKTWSLIRCNIFNLLKYLKSARISINTTAVFHQLHNFDKSPQCIILEPKPAGYACKTVVKNDQESASYGQALSVSQITHHVIWGVEEINANCSRSFFFPVRSVLINEASERCGGCLTNQPTVTCILLTSPTPAESQSMMGQSSYSFPQHPLSLSLSLYFIHFNPQHTHTHTHTSLLKALYHQRCGRWCVCMHVCGVAVSWLTHTHTEAGTHANTSTFSHTHTQMQIRQKVRKCKKHIKMDRSLRTHTHNHTHTRTCTRTVRQRAKIVVALFSPSLPVCLMFTLSSCFPLWLVWRGWGLPAELHYSPRSASLLWPHIHVRVSVCVCLNMPAVNKVQTLPAIIFCCFGVCSFSLLYFKSTVRADSGRDVSFNPHVYTVCMLIHNMQSFSCFLLGCPKHMQICFSPFLASYPWLTPCLDVFEVSILAFI